MEKTIKFKITGMHCASCAMNIDGELEDLGVKEASTNYARAESSVTFDEEKVSVQDIQETIKNLGYIAEPINL